MDRTEAHVRKHLVSRGCSGIRYEPDGKVPPDFVVDGGIAVEARRLNQHDKAGRRGLEETRVPLGMRLCNLIRGTSSSSADTKWIEIEMRRPFPPWRDVEPAARDFLRCIDEGSCQPGSTASIGNLRLGFRLTTSSKTGAFKPSAILDHDWGGIVLTNLLTNLELCVREKSQKTAAYRTRYEHWWLALVDYIGYGLDETLRLQLREGFKLQHDWDKIILINPDDHSDHVDL